MHARRTLGLIILAVTLFSRSGGADPAAPHGVITLSDGEGFGFARPAAFLAGFRRVLEAARRSFTLCHDLALAEDPNVAAEIEATIKVSPNGEVDSVLMSKSAAADTATACFRNRLARLQFEPPGATGMSVRVVFILGEPAAAGRSRFPFRVAPPLGTAPPPMSLGLIVMRLDMPAPAPAFRGVHSAVGFVQTCAKDSNRDAVITLDAHLLVTAAGSLASFEVTSGDPSSEALTRCIAKKVWPEERGRLTRVDLRLRVAPNGEVSVAR